MRSRGFALTELLVALVIAGVIGAALARLVISQARFVSVQDAMMQARSSARSALNVLGDELRMVGPGGLRAASRDSITARVPYAFGAACLGIGGWRVVGLLPADSALYAGASGTGFAWLDSLGTWRFVQPATINSVWSGYCSTPIFTYPPVTILSAPGWSGEAVAVNPSPGGIRVGSPVYLYQTITYRFAASNELPGTVALWRSVPGSGLNEEMVAPFDSTARFEFLVGDTLGLQTTPPPSLDSVRGVRVFLSATSARPAEGRTTVTRFPLSTNLVFRGRAR